MQSPIADEIVTLVDQIITIQGQISEQFPQIFENIVKENLAKNITSSLNNIYQTQSLALQNLREIEDLETKIIYFRILYDTNLPMPKDKYVYPVPPQEENEIVSAQTQNDEIDENPENDDQEQMIVDLEKEELNITIENNTTDDIIENPDLFQIKEKID